MTEPAPRPRLDVRVGSSTDGLTPVSVAERPLAAGAHEWIGLLAVAGAAIVADQVTKRPGVEGFMAGFERALIVAAVFAFVGSIVAFALVRQETEQAAAPVELAA